VSRSDAARRANETRKLRAPEVEADIAVLRGGHFTGLPKSEVRQEVVRFLAEHTREGEAVGDLLGPGWSALALREAGMAVISAETCEWSGRVLGDRARAERAARRMAADGGFVVELAPFAKIVPSVRTAFYDTCGPYLEPSSRDVRAMAQAELSAFVVTVLFSRVEGMRGKSPEHYRRMAEVGLEIDAPAYRIVKVCEYRGESNLPMAAFFLLRAGTEVTIAPRRANWRERYTLAERRRGVGTTQKQTTTELAEIIRAIVESHGGAVPARDAWSEIESMGLAPSASLLFRARTKAGVITRAGRAKDGWFWLLPGATPEIRWTSCECGAKTDSYVPGCVVHRASIVERMARQEHISNVRDKWMAEAGGDPVLAYARALGISRQTARRHLA
jgi:hypothetical protein